MTSAKLRVPRAFCTEDGDVWWAPGHVDPTAMLLAVALEQMTLVGAQEAANLITDPRRFDGIDDDRKPIYRQATVEEQLTHADMLLCQLPEGHSWQFHHWRKADLNGSVERTWRRQPVQTCTGLAATWCPVHGDCTCPSYGADGDHHPEERHLDAPSCPLHSPTSTHPEEP